MHGFNYNNLNEKDREFFDTMFDQLKNAQNECIFKDTEFDYAAEIYRNVLADNPQLFWLTESSKAQLLRNDDVSYLFFKPDFRIEEKPETLRNMQIKLRNAVLQTVNLANEFESDYQKILFVHDYLIKNCKYLENGVNCYNTYGCLVEKEAVCSGFTMAFQLIMNTLKIPCGNVTGGILQSIMTESRHIWNYVVIDGEYYYIDVTCDSPFKNTEFYPNNKRYDFFLINAEELALTHEIICKRFVPECKADKYNYFNMNNLILQEFSLEELYKIAKKQLESSNVFCVKFTSKEECEKAYCTLTENQKCFEAFGIDSAFKFIKSASELIIYARKEED